MLHKRHDSILMFNIGVSAFSLSIVLMLALNPPTTNEILFWRKPLVGLVFSLICAFGISSAFFPKQCSEAFHFRKGDNNFISHLLSQTLKGHHPDCGKFSRHIMRSSNYTLCAACTGLCLGAFMVLVGSALYFFGGLRFEEMGFPAVLIGIVKVIVGFFQLKFMGFVRLASNAFFVLGAFLILVGIDELTQSLFVDLVLVIMIVFWILTRILLSQWDHSRICNSCESPCRVRELGKNRV